MKDVIETRVPAESKRRAGEEGKHPVYQEPQMFVIGSANRLMRGAHKGGVKDKGKNYYHIGTAP